MFIIFSCAVAFESRKCTVDSFVSSLFFCMHFAVVTKRRVYQRDRRCSLFLSLSFKRAETRAAWVQTRVSWIGRRTFIQGAHNRYRGHNNKACACKIRCVQLRVTRVSFERGDCLLLIVKKKKNDDATTHAVILSSYA